jgi:hypothetical protein
MPASAGQSRVERSVSYAGVPGIADRRLDKDAAGVIAFLVEMTRRTRRVPALSSLAGRACR